jgi:hypothetical protein
MTKDEALRLALECIEAAIKSGDWKVDGACDPTMAIEGVKYALEAKDEPVATKNNDGVTLHLGWDDLPVGTKLYITPPQRTWVGLTDEEILTYRYMIDWTADWSYIKFARAIEAAHGIKGEAK